MCGISLILVPTIVYGGLTVLYVISNGAADRRRSRRSCRILVGLFYADPA
jgi:hypothetical protein